MKPTQSVQRQIALVALTVLVLVPANTLLSARAGVPAPGTAIPDSGTTELLVQFRPATDPARVAADYGATLHGKIKGTHLFRVTVPGPPTSHVIEQMMRDPRLFRIEPDNPVTAPEGDSSVNGDPVHVPFDFSTSLSSAGTDLLSSGDVINGDDSGQIQLLPAQLLTLGAGVTVAVLDTGVDATHPLLAGRLIPGYNAITPDSAPDDAPTGVTNAAYGHGTMVSGIIARVAPGARILPVRVLDADGNGDLFTVIAGIRYAVSQGAQVINLSLGTPYYSQFLADALAEAENAGCIVVAAAGNTNSGAPYYPAALNGVLGIMAVDGANHKASFSNYGPTVSLSAPGVGIRSSFPGGWYASWSGTSFSTPFVSGTVALTMAANPRFNTTRVIQRVWETASNLNSVNPTFAGQIGRGMLNADRAVGH